MSQLRIDKSIVRGLFKQLARKDDFPLDGFIDAFVNNCSDSQLNYMLKITTEPTELIYQGDYVKLKWSELTTSDEKVYSYSDCIDSGFAEDGYMFGQVLEDGSWRSEYNPFEGTVKLKILLPQDADASDFEITLSTTDVIKIDKYDIPYFKMMKDG